MPLNDTPFIVKGGDELPDVETGRAMPELNECREIPYDNNRVAEVDHRGGQMERIKGTVAPG